MGRNVVTRTGRVTRINDDGTQVLCREGYGKPWVGPPNPRPTRQAPVQAARVAPTPRAPARPATSRAAVPSPAVLAQGAAHLRAVGLLEAESAEEYGPGEAYPPDMFPELQAHRPRAGRVAGFYGGA